MRLGAGSRRGGSLAPGLPVPYAALENAGFRPRRGQTSLTVSGTGVGKSQLWNNLAQRMRVPTLYWSADTDLTDVTIRTLAIWSGLTTTEVESRAEDQAWRDWMFGQLSEGRHVDWVFDTPITGKLAVERLDAFAEKHGTYPHLTVIDNLSNTVVNTSDSLSEQTEVMAAMQRLARESMSHIAMLHHAKGEYDTGDKPIPKNGALNNLFKTVELGVTAYRPSEDTIAINIVKARGAASDPKAQRPTVLHIDFARATVKGFR